jgi:EpsI family protein
MTLPLASTTAHPSAPAHARVRLKLALAFVALVFWPTWISFPSTWQETGWHNVFVVAFCAWFAWRERASFHVGADRLGLATVGVAAFSVLWLLSYVLHLRVLHQAAVPALLMAWLLATAGWRTFVAMLPVATTFFLAVPLWGSLIRPLQTMTVLANSALLGVTGIAADIQGDFIVLESGVLWVARGCAGLNFFEIGVFVGIVYALLFLQSWRARAWAVALAALLALVSNWLRVFGLVVVADVTAMQSSLIADHELYGWAIFAVMLGIYFRLARRLESMDAEDAASRQSGIEGASSEPEHALSLRALALPTGAALIGPLLYLGLGAREAATSVPDAIPGVAPLAEWSTVGEARGAAVDSGLPAWHPALHGADSLRRIRYVHADGRTATVDRLVYFTQRQGKELISDGNRFAPDSLRLGRGTVGPVDSTGRLINVTVVKEDDRQRLIWSWYQVAGMTTHSAVEGKLFELIGFFTGQRTAELVAVSTPCDPTDECRSAAATLFTFVTGAAPPDSPPPSDSALR